VSGHAAPLDFSLTSIEYSMSDCEKRARSTLAVFLSSQLQYGRRADEEHSIDESKDNQRIVIANA
jgi:hypothetical protein